MPNPKQLTNATTDNTQAVLTHAHQRLRVSVRLDTEAMLNALGVETERSKGIDAGGWLRDGKSSVGFTNDFSETYGLE